MSMIGPETAAFLQSGCALIVGTVDPDGAPYATRGWGLTLLSDDPLRFRLLLNEMEQRAVAHLGDGGAIAITGTNVRTLYSVQLKGHAASIEPGTDADTQRALRYADDFIGDIHETNGTPRELSGRLIPTGYVAVVVEVAEVFDQTPGPRAGTSLVESGR